MRVLTHNKARDQVSKTRGSGSGLGVTGSHPSVHLVARPHYPPVRNASALAINWLTRAIVRPISAARAVIVMPLSMWAKRSASSRDSQALSHWAKVLGALRCA